MFNKYRFNKILPPSPSGKLLLNKISKLEILRKKKNQKYYDLEPSTRGENLCPLAIQGTAPLVKCDCTCGKLWTNRGPYNRSSRKISRSLPAGRSGRLLDILAPVWSWWSSWLSSVVAGSRCSAAEKSGGTWCSDGSSSGGFPRISVYGPKGRPFETPRGPQILVGG